MSTNTIVSLIIISVVAVIFSYLFLSQIKEEVVTAPTGSVLTPAETSLITIPPIETQTSFPVTTSIISPSTTKSPTKTVTPTQTPTPTAKIITYTDSGFSPSPLAVKAGETVLYKNESSRSFWPASASHPTHAVYLVYGGCINSIFDACKAYDPGESWSFTFTVKGTWGYHDHINPSYFGSVVVE